MTIQEFQEKKKVLEIELLQKIQEFESQCGVGVHDVHIITSTSIGQISTRVFSVNVEIKL
jgi:hypothetical protein